MKHLIFLDENDIREFIAERFSVNIEKVTVTPYITTEGHGMGEHDVAKVKVSVEVQA